MTNNYDAQSASSSAPRSDEARLQPGLVPSQTNYAKDSAGRMPIEQNVTPIDLKQFRTLQARLAVAGYELSLIAAGDGPQIFTVYRWGMSRALIGLTAVELFVDRVGVPS